MKKESPNKKTPKPSKADEVPDEVPPSLEKKKSSYRSFMARDGPRALGSKSIPEVREERICKLITIGRFCVMKAVSIDATRSTLFGKIEEQLLHKPVGRLLVNIWLTSGP